MPAQSRAKPHGYLPSAYKVGIEGHFFSKCTDRFDLKITCPNRQRLATNQQCFGPAVEKDRIDFFRGQRNFVVLLSHLTLPGTT